MKVIDEDFYTDATPRKSGYYWCFSTDYPVPQIYFLQWCMKDNVWKLYASGGYATGMPWTTQTYRSKETLEAPAVYTEIFAIEGAL